MSTPTHEQDFYACPIRLEGKKRYLLWYSGPTDGVWLDQHNVMTWNSRSTLDQYAARQNITLSTEDSATYDLDRIGDFIQSNAEIDTKEKLDAWNLFADIASSVGATEFLEAEQQHLDLYNHLFYLTGSAPVKNTAPEHLTPAENEIARQILSLGLHVLRHHIHIEEDAGS